MPSSAAVAAAWNARSADGIELTRRDIGSLDWARPPWRIESTPGVAPVAEAPFRVCPITISIMEDWTADREREASRKVVVVTGASAGVGRATIREFARGGATIGLIARGREGLEAAAREVEAAGGRALVLPVDVADAAAVEAAAETVEQKLGPIDVWVNNAMTSVFAPVNRLAADEVRRVTEVTYLGTAYGTMAALRWMRPRDAGVIVQVGSALAYRSIPLQAAYCAAKHAMVGFTDSLRSELVHDGSGVRVTVVHLPAMNTPQFDWVRSRLPRRARPVPPIYQPEVAARAIVWASEHPVRELRVGTPTLLAIAAQKTIPGLLDWYLGRTGFDAQQGPEAEEPGRPDNLFAPVPGDGGAHGRFERDAREHSPEAWLATHRAAVLGIAALLVGSSAAIARRGR
jgi:NAD(P)-dependent dehydrogenase (short-subunit alcohol dehydrogenase family)